MGLGDQRQVLAPLPPGKTRYPLYGRLGGPHDRSRRLQEISPPTGIESQDRQPDSVLLYRLRYPGPQNNEISVLKIGQLASTCN